MRFIGRREGVAADLVERMEWAEATTAGQRRGSRCSSPSTTAAGRRSSTRREAFEGEREDEFRGHLYAPEMHDPDLLIRTSGEQRISNFLLWQCAYSELVFRDELWPDFDREAFEAALDEYATPRRGASGAASDGGIAPVRLASSTSTTRGATGPRPPPPLPGAARPAPRGAAATSRRSAAAPRRSRGSPGRCPGSRSWSRSRSSAASCSPRR